MQSIKAKKEGMMRVFGMGLILFGLIISIIFDFFIIDMMLYFFLLLIVVPWFILIILLKLEKDFFVEKMLIFMVGLVIYSAIIIIITLFISLATLTFIATVISNVLIILCWQFALSIYKKKKLVFLLGGIGYCVLTVIFRLESLIIHLIWFVGLVPLALIILGMLLIIVAEIMMKKKGLLNWI